MYPKLNGFIYDYTSFQSSQILKPEPAPAN